MKTNQPWLWNRMAEFAGICQPRWTWMVPIGIPPSVAGLTKTSVILGQQRHFQGRERVRALLRDIEYLAGGLDRETWESQFDFLTGLFGSFFIDSELPGWIHVCPANPGFQQRVKQERGKPKHKAYFGKVQFESRHLGSEWLRLGERPIWTGGLRMHHPHSGHNRRLQIQQIFIERIIRDDGLGAPVHAWEEWYFLLSRDPEERRTARRGMNPGVEQYRDAVTGIKSAPIFSLCRLACSGKCIATIGISLVPAVGEVLDLRPSMYEIDYFFRSHMTNHVMLERILTPGKYERWANG